MTATVAERRVRGLCKREAEKRETGGQLYRKKERKMPTFIVGEFRLRVLPLTACGWTGRRR